MLHFPVLFLTTIYTNCTLLYISRVLEANAKWWQLGINLSVYSSMWLVSACQVRCCSWP